MPGLVGGDLHKGADMGAIYVVLLLGLTAGGRVLRGMAARAEARYEAEAKRAEEGVGVYPSGDDPRSVARRQKMTLALIEAEDRAERKWGRRLLAAEWAERTKTRLREFAGRKVGYLAGAVDKLALFLVVASLRPDWVGTAAGFSLQLLTAAGGLVA